MQSPPLHLVSHTHYYCGGNVNIAPTAAIASGVVLQALPGASIDIGAGVCLGAGVVIQAKSGAVTVEREASLGTSVLIVGHGIIGQGACIGPASTLINPTIEAHGIIPPNSLRGDQARRAEPSPESGYHSTASSNASHSNGAPGVSSGGLGASGASGTRGVSGAGFQSFNKTVHHPPAEPQSTYQDQTFNTSSSQGFSPGPATVPISPRTTSPIEPKPVDIPDLSHSANGFSSEGGHNGTVSGSGSSGFTAPAADSQQSSLAVNNNGYVYGRDQVNGLLSALFPHRQNLNGP